MSSYVGLSLLACGAKEHKENIAQRQCLLPVVCTCVHLTCASPRHSQESHGEAGQIHISEACYSCLRSKERFEIRERGNITVKGKGTMRVRACMQLLEADRLPMHLVTDKITTILPAHTRTLFLLQTYLLSPLERIPCDSLFAPLPQLHVTCNLTSPDQPMGPESMPASCLECLLQECRSSVSPSGGYPAPSPRRAIQPAMVPDECTSPWGRVPNCWEAAPLSSVVADAGFTAARGSCPGTTAEEPWRATAGPSSHTLLVPPGLPRAGRSSVDAVREERGMHSSRPAHVPVTPQAGMPAGARLGPSSASGGHAESTASSTSCGLVGIASPPGTATAATVAAAAAARVTTYLDVSAEMLSHISNARSARSAGGTLAAGFSWSGPGGQVSLSSPLSPRTRTPRHMMSMQAPQLPDLRTASISGTLAAKLSPLLVAAHSGTPQQEAYEEPEVPNSTGGRDMYVVPGTADNPCLE